MRALPLSAVFFVGLLGCGTSDPCATNPASCADAANGTCAGVCAPRMFAGGSFLLWSGSPNDTPLACPVNNEGLLGYLDTPPTVVDCPACTCASSTGTCAEPSTMVANTGACPGTGTGLPFDAPQVWDGACTSMDAVTSADSVSVTPYVPHSQGCFPWYGEPLQLAGGSTRAETCVGEGFPDGTCASDAEQCTVTKVDGFSVCLFFSADEPCPDGWTDRHTYYDDLNECSCSCGAPVGETCSSTVEVFSDGTCSTMVGSLVASSASPGVCVNVTAGSPLGSKSATLPVYTAGACAPSLAKSVAETFCCLP